MYNTAHKQFTQFELSKLIISNKLFSKISVSPSARLVLMALCSHYPNIKVKAQTLAEESGCSVRSVENALKELKDREMLLVVHTGRSSKYYLTEKFFEHLGVVEQMCRNVEGRSEKIAEHMTCNKYNNNKNNKLFLKKDETVRRKYHHNTQVTGIRYPKAQPVDLTKESPLDMSKEQAECFLFALPKNLQNSFFALELRKKWGL